MRAFSIFLFALALLGSAGCATSTPYQKASDANQGLGYYDSDPRPQADGTTLYEVGIRASEATSDSTIQAYWRRRAAEICGGPAGASDTEIKRWLEKNKVIRPGSPNSPDKGTDSDHWEISRGMVDLSENRHIARQTQGFGEVSTVTTSKKFTIVNTLQHDAYCPAK